MKLIIQPDEGLTPLTQAVKRAKQTIDIVIFRFDRPEMEKALAAVETRKLASLRLHVRAIIRDGTAAFVGSQSLRKLELDGRREVGVIVTDGRTARKLQSVFEADWAEGTGAPTPASVAE